MKSSSISITFGKEAIIPDPPPVEDGTVLFLSLSLDSVANKGKYAFVVGDKIYLKFLSSDSGSYAIKVNTGTAKTEATNIHYPIKNEEIQFANTDTGTLSYFPCGGVSYKWIGESGGTPVFDGKDIILAKPVVGILVCDYETKGDRLSISSSIEGTVLVAVIQKSDQASLSVSFEKKSEEEEEKPEPVAYELEVKDYCADGVLPGVTIYLDGIDIGQTDANGVIAVGALIPGSTHSLKMAKGGYINSENDKLNNDSFTVPA